MINIAICDDEKYILDKIKKLVFDFFHRKNVEITVSQFGSGEELLRHNKNIDILFLDIQMCVFYFGLDNLNLILLKFLFLLHEFQKVVFHQVFLLNRL